MDCKYSSIEILNLIFETAYFFVESICIGWKHCKFTIFVLFFFYISFFVGFDWFYSCFICFICFIYIYIFSTYFSSFSISLLSTNSFLILGVDGNPMLGARTYTPNPCHIWTRIYRASGYLQTHHVPVLTPCSWACPPCAPAYPPCEPAWAPCTPVCPPCEPAWVYFYRFFISSGFRVINF